MQISDIFQIPLDERYYFFECSWSGNADRRLAGTSGIGWATDFLLMWFFLRSSYRSVSLLTQTRRSPDATSPHETRGPAGGRIVKRDLDRLSDAQTSTFNPCPIRDSAAGGP